MNAAAVHLALNNFPPIVSLVGLCLLVGGLSARSAPAIRASFAVLLCAALIAIPAYIAGRGAEDIVKRLQGVNVAAIDPHEEAATAGLIFVLIEGVVALVALIVRPRRALTIAVLLLSIVSTVTLFYAARLGGKIHHPETQMRRA